MNAREQSIARAKFLVGRYRVSIIKRDDGFEFRPARGSLSPIAIEFLSFHAQALVDEFGISID